MMKKEKYSQRLGFQGIKLEECLIQNLSDYIKILSKKNLDEHIFRGENTNYFNTESSAIRKYSNQFGKSSPEYPFIKMKNEFKNEIWYKLDAKESNDFLAFSQHHGLPTNLIDFTYAPLVALYFACQPFVPKDECQSNYDKENGYIYYLKTSETIDITEIINRVGDKNILDEFVRDKEIFKSFYVLFNKFHKENDILFKKYLKELIVDIKFYFSDKKIKYDIKKNIEHNQFLKIMNDFGLAEFEYKHMLSTIANMGIALDWEAITYTILLHFFLVDCNRFQHTYKIRCIPPMLYRPLLSFERARNQQGLFIYQCFLSLGKETTYDTYCLLHQEIATTQVIVIKNKVQILKELDMIGINSKFIFSDYDHIATYIKDNYNRF